MLVRGPVHQRFDRRINPDHLWGLGKHTFYSKDPNVERATCPEEMSGDASFEVTGFNVFGEIVVGGEAPEIEIYRLDYVEDTENPYKVQFAFGEGLVRNVRTNELMPPEVLRKNPDLIIQFRILQEQLLENDRLDLAEQVGELIAQAS